MNYFNIRQAFARKKKEKWPKLYWAIDLHHTIIVGKFSKFNEGRAFCPNALRVLTWLSNREDMKWILYTSSHDDAIADIAGWMHTYGVGPNFVNGNPECEGTFLCDFSRKFYFDILLEDKSGFECDKDWFNIEKELRAIGEWQEPDVEEDGDPRPPKVPILDYFRKLAQPWSIPVASPV